MLAMESNRFSVRKIWKSDVNVKEALKDECQVVSSEAANDGLTGRRFWGSLDFQGNNFWILERKHAILNVGNEK